MAERRDKTLFQQPWFTGTVFAGVEAALQDREQAERNHERFLLNALFLHLLDVERESPDASHVAVASFFAFCQRNIHDSHAQILQDLWVLYMTGEKRDGYFVEFGACDGKSLSNTLLLEQAYGWNGILAEPNPFWHDALAANRKCAISQNCVAPVGGEEVEFIHVTDMPELSRMAAYVPDDVHERDGARNDQPSVRVPTVSLKELLDSHDAPREIDYLSVDTEGSEHAILEAFDFSRYRFRLVTVEHGGDTTKREAIRALLAAQGYNNWMPELTRWEDWFTGPGFGK